MPSTPVEDLRKIYHNHLASERTYISASCQGRGSEGRKEGRVAGKETRRGMRQASQWYGLSQSVWTEFEDDFRSHPQNLMVWSDLHLDHENIIKYSRRPFGGSFHMNSQLLANAQKHVTDEQWLLFVGDLAMWKDREKIEIWMSQCPGRKALIIGNHDVRGRECPKRFEDWQTLGFDAVSDVFRLPAAHGFPQVWITHYPIPMDNSGVGIINLHGHTHTKVLGPPWANACVEQIDYRPRPILDLLKLARG